jgi:glutamate formiminotransferase/glutamate formiminotransferase/formiminotetrahydrofolate cyclodeaminase
MRNAMPTPALLAVPNISEGRDGEKIAAIGAAFAGPNRVRLLDTHSDGDHHRTVFTLAGPPGALADALLDGARAAVKRIDIGDGRGAHPHVGAIDVVPVVYLDDAARGAACAAALVVADRIGEELGVPVFLYGVLAGGRTRAELRRGGAERLAERVRRGELRPDFGPRTVHPGAGATLVAAREPLVAFNLQLGEQASVEDARRIAGLIRAGGEQGLPGLRAIGIELSGAVAQVSTNVERPLEVPLARVVEAVRCHAEVASAELVGLAPRAALAGFPEELQLVGFDPTRHLIESALGE